MKAKTTRDKTINIIGVPMDMGQGRRGVDMGPSAFRYVDLQERLLRLGYEVVDLGNLEVPTPEQDREPEDVKLPHMNAVSRVNQNLADTVEKSLSEKNFPIILGGDHSIAGGSVAGARRVGKPGLLWIDAHGDFNTPATSPSGNLHGMPLAALMGYKPTELAPYNHGTPLDSSDVVIIGVRDLDQDEKRLILESGILTFTMRDLDERGIAEVTRQALEHFTRVGVEEYHVSFDLDALDPQIAPGVGTPVSGGITYREAHLLMELLCEDERAVSLDVVELNPILDVRSQTAEMGVELVASLLGQRIL